MDQGKHHVPDHLFVIICVPSRSLSNCVRASEEILTINKSGDGPAYDTTSLSTVFPAFGVLPKFGGEQGTLAKHYIVAVKKNFELISFPEAKSVGILLQSTERRGTDRSWPTLVPSSRWLV